MLGLSNNLVSGGFVDTFANLKSISLDGSDEYLNCGDVADQTTNDFTVAFWFKWDSSIGAYAGIVTKRANLSADTVGWSIVFRSTAKTIYSYIDAGSSSNAVDYGGNALTSGIWYHCAVVFDRSDKLQMYIDGVESGSGTDISGVSASLTNSTSLIIGDQPDQSNFFGNIDGVSIWNVALDADAVAEIYANGKGIDLRSNSGDYTSASSLVAYYRCGDGKLGTDADGTDDVIFDMDNASLGSETSPQVLLNSNEITSWTVGAGTATFDTDHYILTRADGGDARMNRAISPTPTVGSLYKVTVTAKRFSGSGYIKVGMTNGSDNQDAGNLTFFTPSSEYQDFVVYLTGTSNRTHATLWNTTQNDVVHYKGYSIKRVQGNPATMVNMEEADIQTEVPKQVKGLPAVSNTYSLAFDGSDEYVDCGDINAMDGASALTISAWMKRTSADDHVTVAKDLADGTNRVGINMYSDGEVYLNMSHGGSDLGAFTSNDTSWHHVAMVFDGSFTDGDEDIQNAGRLKGYLDGIEQTLDFNGDIETTTDTNSASFVIGKSPSNSSFTDGNIDGVAVWNTALDSDSIRAIWNNGVPTNLKNNTGAYDEYTDNLVAYYRCGDGTLDSYPLIGDEVTPTLTEKVTNGDASAESPSPLTMDDGDGDAIAFTEYNGTEVSRYTVETAGVTTSWKLTTETGGSYSDGILLKIFPNADGNYTGKAFYVSCKVYIPTGVGITSITLQSVFASTSNIDSTATVGSWVTLSGYTPTFITGTGHSIILITNMTDNASANFLSTDWSIKLVNGNAGILTNMSESDIAEDTP